MNILNPNLSTLKYIKKIIWPLWRHKNLINIHELFENCLQMVQTTQIQIAIPQGLIRIFACGFLHCDSWNNAFKAVMKKTEI